MEFTARQIAEFVQGEISGNPEARVNKISRIEEACEGSLCFLANAAYEKYLYSSKPTIVLVHKDFHPDQEITATLIRVDDPYFAFTKILQYIQQIQLQQNRKKGIASTAVIDETVEFEDSETVWVGDYVVIGSGVRIGKNVQIYPHVFIDDNCCIGADTVIYSGVKIYHSSQIGQRCIIHSGVVIGADGFGFAPRPDGSYEKIPQTGNVIVEDDVEIGANTTIDRATLGSTIIRQGTKLDNLIMVAHNCEIGKHTVIASQSGFSGSTKIGDYCKIGGQVGVAGHLKIGNYVTLAAKAGITNHVPDGSKLMGAPAIDAAKFKRIFILSKHLEEIVKRIDVLEKQQKTQNRNR